MGASVTNIISTTMLNEMHPKANPGTDPPRGHMHNIPALIYGIQSMGRQDISLHLAALGHGWGVLSLSMNGQIY